VIVILAFALILVLAPFPPEALENRSDTFEKLQFFGWVIGGVTVLLTLLLIMAVRSKQKCQDIFKIFICWLPQGLQQKLVQDLDSFLGGLHTFTSLSATFRAFGWTITVWFTILLSEYFTILAFGFQIPLYATMILMAILAFAVMVPQGPAYLGPFQLASELTLVLCFAIAASEAKAFAFVLWVAQVLPIILLGMVCLHLEGLTPQQMWRYIKQPEQENV